MRRGLAAVCAVLILTTGCGGDDEEADGGRAVTDPASSAAASAQASTEGDAEDREKALMTAAQGYIDALLAGRLAGVLGYLDPKACDEEDETSYALTVGQISEVAEGAKMTITSVTVQGDRGGVRDYKLSDGAPDQLRRLVKASMAESKQYAWNYKDGEWYLAGPCED